MSMFIGSAVRRQGRQGDFLGIGKAISRVTGFVGGLVGKVAPSLPFPFNAAAKGGSLIYKGISRVTAPGTQMVQSRPVLPPLPGAGFAGGGFGGGGGGGLVLAGEKQWPTNRDGSPRRMRRDGKPWKRPSMNFANGRAIKRAARRLEGAEKLFRRVFSIRHGGSAGRVTPKGKGRR